MFCQARVASVRVQVPLRAGVNFLGAFRLTPGSGKRRQAIPSGSGEKPLHRSSLGREPRISPNTPGGRVHASHQPQPSPEPQASLQPQRSRLFSALGRDPGAGRRHRCYPALLWARTRTHPRQTQRRGRSAGLVERRRPRLVSCTAGFLKSVHSFEGAWASAVPKRSRRSKGLSP